MVERSEKTRRPLRKRIRNYLAYLAIRCLLWFVGLLNWRSAQRLGAAFGVLVYVVAAGERAKVIANLRLAYGEELTARERTKLTRAVFISLGRGLFELFNVLGGTTTSPLDLIAEFKGEEHLRAVLAEGKGAVVLSCHLGNWDLMALYMAARGYRVNAVARELFYPRLDELFNRLLRAKGVNFIMRQSSLLSTMRALYKNQLLGLLADQDTRVESVFADFFGVPAKTPVGPVKLAYASGAALIPVFITRDTDGRHRIVVEPPLRLFGSKGNERALEQDVAACNKIIERHVRRCPEQWVWMHERWKTRPV